jgi:hypothetical protein
VVSLTKIVDGNPAVSGTLPNEQTVRCPRCEQTYRFAYTDDEWNKVSAWLGKADRAMRETQDRARRRRAAIAVVTNRPIWSHPTRQESSRSSCLSLHLLLDTHFANQFHELF